MTVAREDAASEAEHVAWYRREWVGPLIDRVLVPAFFLFTLFQYMRSTPVPSTSDAWVQYVLNIIRFTIIPVFLILSRRALDSRLTVRAGIGIVLSLAVPIVFRFQASDDFAHLATPFDVLHAGSIFVVGVIYTVMLIVAYFNLGRNLSVTPALKAIVTSGLYRFVRHPVYAATLHLAAIFLLVYPNLINVGCLVGLNLGLYLRISEEEALLRQDPGYAAYMEQVSFRTYSPMVSSPLVFLLVLRVMTLAQA